MNDAFHTQSSGSFMPKMVSRLSARFDTLHLLTPFLEDRVPASLREHALVCRAWLCEPFLGMTCLSDGDGFDVRISLGDTPRQVSPLLYRCVTIHTGDKRC